MSRAPLRQRPLAFLDIETTGLRPPEAEIIEIAIILASPSLPPLRERLFRVSKRPLMPFAWKVKPKHPETAHPRALEVNGYNPDEWGTALPLEKVLPLVVEKLKGCVIAGQNPRFDVGFIDYYQRELGIEGRFDYHLVDVSTLAYEHLVPCGLTSLSLKSLCEFVGVEPEPDVHRALEGARAALRVYEKLCRAGLLSRLWWRLKNGLH